MSNNYDDSFSDLYSIINQIKFNNVLECEDGVFAAEGKEYRKYKDKFDKYYDKKFLKTNNFSNSNSKKIIEGIRQTSNTKTNSSSSKKNKIPNIVYNDRKIVNLNI